MDAGFAFKFGRIFRLSYGCDGVDFIDQMNSQFTSGLFILFISIIGFRQYVGKPIQCWVPQEFTSSWEEYAENICWVSNTYFLLSTENVPETDTEQERLKFISYYQWVAIMFMGQALLAWIPHIFWRVGSARFPRLVRTVKRAAIPYRESRQKAISSVVSAIEEVAESYNRYRQADGIIRKCLGGPPPNVRVTFLFFIVRLMYMGTCVGQIYLMQWFIGFKDPFFGYAVLRDLVHGQEWENTGTFPRETFCNVNIKKLGQILPATYTIQCVLPMNYFIEKVYIFLWFWFTLLLGLTFLNTLQWLVELSLFHRRQHFVNQNLRALRQISNQGHRDCRSFVSNLLGCDGVFLLMIISRSVSELITLDVILRLWTDFRQARLSGKEDDSARFIQNMKRGSRSSILV